MLEGVRAQTFKDWILLVRDDVSTDETMQLVEQWAATESRVSIIRDNLGNLGCVGNFSRLAIAALERGARYVFLADQDDLWFAEKMEQTLARMRELERQLGGPTPVLIHSDLQVIDHVGSVIAPSFMRFQGIHHESHDPLRMLLVQNFVTGCTVLMNRPLLEMALPVPTVALMHDWWFALCAAAHGTIQFLPQATMAYRRHATNTVTVRGYWRTVNPLKTDWRHLWETGTRDHRRTVLQAQALLSRLQERALGSEGARLLVSRYLELYAVDHGAIGRCVRALDLGLRSQTAARTATLYLRLLSWVRERAKEDPTRICCH
jgi:GT2 family glycosyltransferase